MDEYRGRYEAYGRREHQHHPQREEPPPAHFSEAPPTHPPETAPQQGLLEGFGIGNDFLDEYLPILLILLGALGIYLLLGKQNNGLGGLLGGFLK